MWISLPGFQMKAGAIASSVGHDNHNVIVMGTNFEDMAVAVNKVIEMNGGQIAVKDGEVLASIAYPVCGLLTDLSAEELAALPCFAITDVGFINVITQQVMDPILEVLE